MRLLVKSKFSKRTFWIWHIQWIDYSIWHQKQKLLATKCEEKQKTLLDQKLNTSRTKMGKKKQEKSIDTQAEMLQILLQKANPFSWNCLIFFVVVPFFVWREFCYFIVFIGERKHFHSCMSTESFIFFVKIIIIKFV